MRGFYFIIEGGDGYGKTTQEESLRKSLGDLAMRVQKIREPGGTEIGEAVRPFLVDEEFSHFRSPESQLIGYNFCRSVLVNSVIKPLLVSDIILLSDRSWLSTIAYQAFGEQLDKDITITMCEFAMQGVTPTHIFILDVSVDEALRRLRERAEEGSTYDNKPRDFHERVREGYLWAAKRYKNIVTLVDGERSAEVIAKEILELTMAFVNREHGGVISKKN